MSTTDGFHLYRIEFEGSDLRVYVDGNLTLNADGKFVTPITDKKTIIGVNLPYYLKAINDSGIGFGSFSGIGKSKARCRFIRYNSRQMIIKDLALKIEYSRSENK